MTDKPSIRPLPPEGLDPVERRRGPGFALAALSLLVIIVVFSVVVLDRDDSRAPEDDLATSTSTSIPEPVAQVALLGEDTVWLIDPVDLDVRPITDVVSEVPWRATITSRQVGNVYYLGPPESLDLDDLAGVVYAVMVVEDDPGGPADLPVALVPIWSGLRPRGFDLIYVRSGPQAQWTDITPLPGCGLPFPIAEPDARDALTVWCTDYGEVRVLVEFPQVGDGAEEAVVVDWRGTVWTTTLGASAAFDPAGVIKLFPGDQVSALATLSLTGQTMFVGVSTAVDRSIAEGPRASRLIAYDRVGKAQLWSTETPFPFEAITAGPGGTLFGYFPGDAVTDSALMAFDPISGEASVLISPLDLGPGRLVILSR